MEAQPLSLCLMPVVPPSSTRSPGRSPGYKSSSSGDGGSGIAWRAGDKDPDYYWADAVTGEIYCTKHCLWEEIK